MKGENYRIKPLFHYRSFAVSNLIAWRLVYGESVIKFFWIWGILNSSYLIVISLKFKRIGLFHTPIFDVSNLVVAG